MSEDPQLKTFRELRVWKAAFALVSRIYAIANELPKYEEFGLKSQLRRAAVSIPTNIAEGYGRSNRKEYLQFLGIARGSLAELETLILLTRELHPGVAPQAVLREIDDVSRQLRQLQKSLQLAPRT